MKRILLIVGIITSCFSTVFAQDVSSTDVDHQHVVLQGDWFGHDLIMCGTSKHMFKVPKLVLIFGHKLNSYRMSIGPMYYASSDFHIPLQQYPIAYETMNIKPRGR